mmetsp:Transcript_27172/g.87194  ORF Transcript_27172/g.87194 Transcript_27172/m.87194 type:complete len:108 (-) Transcript_27172:88-411(-)
MRAGCRTAPSLAYVCWWTHLHHPGLPTKRTRHLAHPLTPEELPRRQLLEDAEENPIGKMIDTTEGRLGLLHSARGGTPEYLGRAQNTPRGKGSSGGGARSMRTSGGS